MTTPPVDVTWTPLADTYVPDNRREEFLAEAAKSRWAPANGKHPLSPGLALQEVVPILMRDLGLRGIDDVTYTQQWIMREDNHQAAPYEPDFMINATILGVRSRLNNFTFYLLDLGAGIAPIALVDTREILSP